MYEPSSSFFSSYYPPPLFISRAILFLLFLHLPLSPKLTLLSCNLSKRRRRRRSPHTHTPAAFPKGKRKMWPPGRKKKNTQGLFLSPHFSLRGRGDVRSFRSKRRRFFCVSEKKKRKEKRRKHRCSHTRHRTKHTTDL